MQDIHALRLPSQLLARVRSHLVHEGGEEQEARQRGGAHGVALGDGLGRVAHGVQAVRDAAHVLARARVHLDDAAGVVGDGPEHVHSQHVHGGGEHAHGGHGRAEEAACGLTGRHEAGGLAEVVSGEHGGGDGEHGQAGRLHAHREAGDDVGAVARGGGLRVGDTYAAEQSEIRCKAVTYRLHVLQLSFIICNLSKYTRKHQITCNLHVTGIML